jgi:glycerophosphoryl diester phosphodiesterase
LAPLVIAHRGDCAHRPENTLASFESALALGAEFLELDVQLTRDGHPVVLHDGTLDRTTDGHGAVAAVTLAELKRLSAGYARRFGASYVAERVPTLAEVLALARHRARVMIEVKKESVSDQGHALEAKVLEVVRDAGMAADVVLISFERRALLRFRNLAPEIRRGHLFYRATAEEVVAGAREVATDIVMPEKGMLSDELVAACRSAELRPATWVVDDPAELASLARFGLYGIGSNRPGLLLAAIRAGG